jgi:pimeloyl-ACP methyl ester carboxylesterase
MWGLSKLIPALLAAAVPKTTTDLATNFRKLYSDLGEKGAVYHRASPTIKFVYVTTPTTEGSTWSDDHVVLSEDAHIMQEGGTTNMFEKVANKHETQKPIAIYLPGLDGFGISASSHQFDDLSSSFELWRMHVTIQDRSSFGDLLKHVSDFVSSVSNNASNTNRPVYLIGESFSGLLAPGVALRLQNREMRGGPKSPIKGVVMVNPATSFDDSLWDVTAPLLTTLGALTQTSSTPRPFHLPSPYSVLGGLILSASIPSQEQFQGIWTLLRQLEIGSNPSQILSSLEGMSNMFDVVEEQLPADLLQHRLTKWLLVGSSLVNPRLKQLNVPTLIVVGNDDNLLSSGKEVSRLEKVLPQFEKLVVNRAGHFVLDGNVNLTEAILYSKLDPLNFKERKRPYDPIVDWKLPRPDIVARTLKNVVKPFEDAFSPIYMTTNENGKRIMGFGNLPKVDGPILFVSNHQLCKYGTGITLCARHVQRGTFISHNANGILLLV